MCRAVTSVVIRSPPFSPSTSRSRARCLSSSLFQIPCSPLFPRRRAYMTRCDVGSNFLSLPPFLSDSALFSLFFAARVVHVGASRNKPLESTRARSVVSNGSKGALGSACAHEFYVEVICALYTGRIIAVCVRPFRVEGMVCLCYSSSSSSSSVYPPASLFCCHCPLFNEERLPRFFFSLSWCLRKLRSVRRISSRSTVLWSGISPVGGLVFFTPL